MRSASRFNGRLCALSMSLALAGSACAQGAGPETVIRGTDDGSVVRRDGGTPAVDAGPMCTDDRAGTTCATALSLGASIAVGGMAMSDMAVIPIAGGGDWYSVTFEPSATAMTPGGGTPTIAFAVNEEDAFRFDVLTACGTPATCAMGMSTELTSYSFTDDQSMPGDMQWTTRMNDWPSTLTIRVHRTTPGASCASYRLTVSR